MSLNFLRNAILMAAVLVPLAAPGLPRPQPIVFAGKPVAKTGFSWRSTVRLWYGTLACTAVFLDRDVLVASAHCFKRDPEDGVLTVKFFAGIDVALEKSIRREDYFLVRHPQYADDGPPPESIDKDIAVVTFRHRSVLPEGYQPAMPYWRTNGALGRGTRAIAVGGGMDGRGNRDRLKFARALVIDAFSETIKTFVLESSGLCLGDSGGPLFIDSESGPALAGVLSEVSDELGDKSCGSRADFTYLSPAHTAWILAEADKARDKFEKDSGR